MTRQRKVVGLVLNYRDAKRTFRCLRSILNQGATHVLVWDNSADSGTSAHSLWEMLGEESRVSVHVSESNLGFSSGVNRGIEHIRQRFSEVWILLLNNDAILLPGGMQSLYRTLEQHPQAFISFPKTEQHGCPLGTAWYQPWLALITFRRLPGSFPYPSGCALLFASDRWMEPLFDEDFFMYGEDVFLGWMNKGTGRIVSDPRVWVIHEGSATSHMASLFYERRLVTSHLQLARKISRNRWEYAWLLFGRALTLPARALVRTLRYRSLAPLYALFKRREQEFLSKPGFHPSGQIHRSGKTP